jgi:multimeric flavodoxin WrbA
MKIASILGSPRKKGNTSQVMQWIERELETQSHQADRINVVDFKIKGCKGCFTCKKFTDRPGCPQQDDTPEILSAVMASDIVLYGTPIYFWGPTAQMKTLIDRHCALVTGFATPQWHSLVKGKALGLVLTCEDGVENNTELMTDMFGRFVDYLQCHHAGTLIVPFTSTPDALAENVQEQARTFARELVT